MSVIPSGTANEPLYVLISGASSNPDREMVTTSYIVKTAFTGASVGDAITSIRVIDLSTSTPSQDGATIWYNETTAATLASAPSIANLTISGAPSLTDVQLRATAVPVSNTQLPATLGSKASSASLSVCRSTDDIPLKLETTTRTPVWASGQHVVTSATTAKTTAITGTEVMVSLSSDAYIKIGTQSTITATKGAGSMFLKAGGPYTFQLTSGEGVAVIMDTAAGVMSAIPVA